MNDLSIRIVVATLALAILVFGVALNLARSGGL